MSGKRKKVSPRKLTREELMDQRAARDFEKMARINAETRALTAQIMSEPAPEWQHKGGHAGPSRRNRSW